MTARCLYLRTVVSVHSESETIVQSCKTVNTTYFRTSVTMDGERSKDETVEMVDVTKEIAQEKELPVQVKK